MVDTGRISRPGGDPVFDPVTGLLTPAAGSVVHEGPCRLRMPTAVETNVLFGEQDVTKSRFVACFPAEVTGVEIGDVVTLIESDDADALNREFQVVSVPAMTFVVYRAFGCESVE